MWEVSERKKSWRNNCAGLFLGEKLYEDYAEKGYYKLGEGDGIHELFIVLVELFLNTWIYMHY